MDATPLEPVEPPKSVDLGAYFDGNANCLPTEDVVHVMLPLMHDVAALHHQGRVARLGLRDVAETANGSFALVDKQGVAPASNLAAIQRAVPQVSSALKVVGEYRVTSDESLGTKVEDLRAEGNEGGAIAKPVYLTDLRSWEVELGHHDEITDVFLVGMIMACIACGLDPRDQADIERFSLNRSNLFAIAPRLHPVLASIILEATALNRHERATAPSPTPADAALPSASPA